MPLHDAAREAQVTAAVEAIDEGWCKPPQPVCLYRLSRGLAGRGDIVELGTFAGKSATAIAMGQQDAGGRPMYTVDRKAHPKVEENLRRAGVHDWVRRIVDDSQDAAADWTLPVEFLFIDAGHVYDDVRGDIDIWTPFVAEGGIVALHDYPGWEAAGGRLAIHKAVHETLLAQPDRWQVVSDRECGSLIVFRRINAPPRRP